MDTSENKIGKRYRCNLVRLVNFASKNADKRRLTPAKTMTQSAGSSLFIIFILVHRRTMTHNSARMQKTYTMTRIFVCLDTTGTPHPSPWILATLNCSLTVQDFVKQAVAEAVKAASVHIHVALLMAHGDCDIAVPKHNNYIVCEQVFFFH